MRPLLLCPTRFEASHVRPVARARGAALEVVGVGCGCEAAIRRAAAANPASRVVLMVGISGSLRPQATVGQAFLAERVIDDLVRQAGLPAVIVNPSTPIGPHDVKPTPTGRMIRDAWFGRIPAFVDTGLNLVHVDDVAAGHLLAFARGEIGRRYILGGENLSLRDILAEIARLAGRKPPRIELPRLGLMPIAAIAEAWAWLTHGAEPQVTLDGLRMSRKKMYFSSERAVRELGYQFRPAHEAILAAVDWFRSRPAR